MDVQELMNIHRKVISRTSDDGSSLSDSASLLMNTAQELPWTFIGLETSMN